MKKFGLLAICSLLLFTGCGKKEETVSKAEYDELNSKYKELSGSVDTSKETAYLKDSIESFNVQVSKMGKKRVLEIYIDFSKEADAKKIIDLIHEDWFDYDYVFMIGYGYNQVVGLTQIDVASGQFISSLTTDTTK